MIQTCQTQLQGPCQLLKIKDLNLEIFNRKKLIGQFQTIYKKKHFLKKPTWIPSSLSGPIMPKSSTKSLHDSQIGLKPRLF